MGNEGGIKYRDRVLNSKSKSFCGCKWGNSTLWLNTGETSSCHLPPVHNIDIDQIKKNPAKLHNTDHKIKMRSEMKKGIKPEECEYCWKIENMGDEYISDRVFKCQQFTEEEMDEWFNAEPHTLIVPPTLEIMFDRPCNFACCYCNANFSSSWEHDIKKNGFYELESHGSGAFKHDGTPNNAWENTENPFIKAFWEWWPELSKSLRILRITGGEPLLSNHVWKLIDLCIKEKPNFELSINSNLGGNDKIIDRLIYSSKKLDNFTLYTSMETVHEHAEYTRDGLNYNKWKSNVEKILEESDIKRITIMMTINALCLFRIDEFLDQVLEWKIKYGKKRVNFSINFLRFPAFMSITVLPNDIRTILSDKLDVWYEKNKNQPVISEWGEHDDIKRLLEYVRVVETAHAYDNDLEINRRDFKSFFKQYDKRRNKTIEVFPDYFLNGFYNKCQ
jgi:organic radical activating enzyme